MPAPRRPRRDVIRRRRIDDEGEDEGSITGPPIDDSHSEASLPSDDDGDADDSDLSETDVPDSLGPDDAGSKTNGAVKPVLLKKQEEGPMAIKPENTQGQSFAATQDTEVMMNGLQISEQPAPSEAMDFEAIEDGPISDQQDASQTAPGRQKIPLDRKRQEHEDYKKKRDADPAFIPTRGQFFMHDTRSGGTGPNGIKPFGRGAGRGREVIGGPFSPANMRSQATDATSAPWAHDLHETVQEPALRPGNQQQRGPTSAPGLPNSILQGANVPKVAPVRNFSTTKKLGHAQLRVFLPGMKDPITYANTEIKQYTKLPDHRPPLRRDKPVRVSLPDKGPSYAFPAPDRSFIFIPRAMRPNQQSFGRGGRTRLGSMGGFSSRRTSVFGGSVYSPSVAMSRRSSFAREFDRGSLVSPAGSVRPVVRMPPGSQQHSANGTPVYPAAMSGHGTPVMSHPQQGFPGPQRPTFRENWASNMPMHQPRPQKTVSVAGIESPGSYVYGAPATQDQQPFQHQLPAHVNGGNATQDGTNFYPRPQPQYPTQSTGTPLSNIPERAIHAPAFQPYQQAGFPPAQPAYFYPPSQPQYPGGTVIAPMFVQNGQQGTYIVPTMAPAAPQAVQPPPPPPAGQGGMVAYEQNGMVFYYDASQVPGPPAPEAPSFPNYTMPGMGGMMTPTPDGYYYPQMPSGTVYYQSQ